MIKKNKKSLCLSTTKNTLGFLIKIHEIFKNKNGRSS